MGKHPGIVKFFAILILFPGTCWAGHGPGKAIIKGKLSHVTDGDSVTIISYPYGLDEFKTNQVAKIIQGSFKLIIDQIEKPQYVEIYLPKKYPHTSQKYLVEPGDEIQMEEVSDQIIYSGTGAFKFRCRDVLTQLFFNGIKKMQGNNKVLIPSQTVYQALDSLATTQLFYLRQNKDQLSSSAFNLLKMDVLAEMEFEKDLCALYSNAKRDSVLRLSINRSLMGYKNHSTLELSALAQSHPGLAATSSAFCQSVYSRYNIDSFVLLGKAFNLLQYFDYVVKTYSGVLREALLTDVIYRFKNRDSNIGIAVAKAKDYVKNGDFKNLLAKINSNNSVGAKAFNFTLQGADGKIHSLSDYTGKVLVLDFWYTGCTNCIGENIQLKKIEGFLEKDTNVVFLSISIDTNKDKWIESIQSGKYTTESRVNLFTNGQGSDHPMIAYYSIDGYPKLIIVDPNGNLAEKATDPRQDEGRSLVAIIENLRKNSSD
jgi:alkyl hydroperoxide reductase subunit AhpC